MRVTVNETSSRATVCLVQGEDGKNTQMIGDDPGQTLHAHAYSSVGSNKD